MTITEAIQAAIGKVPAAAWTPPYDGDGQVRDGAWVADVTGLLDLDGFDDPEAGLGPRRGFPAHCHGRRHLAQHQAINLGEEKSSWPIRA
jgi:hypothetical protein